MLKDLFKPGRDLLEYLNEDGSLRKNCLTCVHRPSSKDFSWGGWLCQSDELHDRCNPDAASPQHLLWEARVEDGLFKEEDFNL
jgi:hypothetical protein